MRSSNPSHFSPAGIPNLQSHIAIWSQFANKSFEHAAKLAALNMEVMKTVLEESSSASQGLLTLQDPKDMLTNTALKNQPQIEKALLYGREFTDIWTQIQADFVEVVKAEVEESQHSMQQIAETTSGKAPDGMVNVADWMKSAVDSVNSNYEQFLKAAKESAEAMQNNLMPGAYDIAQAEKKPRSRSKTE